MPSNFTTLTFSSPFSFFMVEMGFFFFYKQRTDYHLLFLYFFSVNSWLIRSHLLLLLLLLLILGYSNTNKTQIVSRSVGPEKKEGYLSVHCIWMTWHEFSPAFKQPSLLCHCLCLLTLILLCVSSTIAKHKSTFLSMCFWESEFKFSSFGLYGERRRTRRRLEWNWNEWEEVEEEDRQWQAWLAETNNNEFSLYMKKAGWLLLVVGLKIIVYYFVYSNGVGFCCCIFISFSSLEKVLVCANANNNGAIRCS